MADLRLVVSVVPAQGVPFLAVLARGDWVGRAPDATVVLDDDGASGQHLAVRAAADRLFLVDQNSTNGTWCAGARVQEVAAEVDLVVRMGATKMRIVAITSTFSTVVEMRPVTSQHWTTEVVRLPTLVVAGSTKGLVFGAAGGQTDAAALLLDGDELALFLPIQGARSSMPRRLRPDADGLLEFASVHLAQVQAREPTYHPTDLAFGGAGELVPVRHATAPEQGFPPALFDAPVVSVADVRALGLPVEERDWLALGAGLGSFVWVDALRVHGVPPHDIRVVGFEDVPYARYKRLCAHSQIPGHERLRSNSESCPDNIWGFPGYGLRESWRAFWRLQWGESARILGQLTGEPDWSATYTPRADDVFASIDREAERVGWAEMAQKGRIRAVRKTDDGRYVVAVSSRLEPGASRAYFIAPVVHLAVGYPGVQFLDDLREYRERTLDFERVVNAYEDHDALYQRLAGRGGTVVLRGRGIVASRILQRLHEERERGADIRVVHLMRAPKDQGSQAGRAQRVTENHWEFQPFNWPEACWGGDLQRELIAASPVRRQELLGAWGGTTTADRPDWRRIVQNGVDQGWYRIVFGAVAHLDGDADGLRLRVAYEGTETPVRCDAVIDATGLVSSVRANPLLADLIDTYGLPRNPQGRLEVDETFELRALRNGDGRVFAAGVATLGSGYAPVDSFLGLQFSALASLEALSRRVPAMGPIRSFGAWTRWATGSAP